VDLADLEARLGAQIVQESVVEWDESAGSARAWRRARLGALVLREAPDRDPDPDPAAVAAVLLAALAADGFRALPWSEQARGIQRRVAFLRALDASWPDLSDDALAVSSGSWLAPRLQGLRRLDEVRRLDLARLLADALTWEQRAALDRLAPTHVTVPSGSRVAIDYADPSAPVLAVRLQELFGLGETPRIADGSVPLILHLLSPARRPVQVTRDLANFWRTGYFTVRKELKGRYPKHYWPDDPLVAEPRRGVRR
jgi:ATP-dependent helicase HrpB